MHRNHSIGKRSKWNNIYWKSIQIVCFKSVFRTKKNTLHTIQIELKTRLVRFSWLTQIIFSLKTMFQGNNNQIGPTNCSYKAPLGAQNTTQYSKKARLCFTIFRQTLLHTNKIINKQKQYLNNLLTNKMVPKFLCELEFAQKFCEIPQTPYQPFFFFFYSTFNFVVVSIA